MTRISKRELPADPCDARKWKNNTGDKGKFGMPVSLRAVRKHYKEKPPRRPCPRKMQNNILTAINDMTKTNNEMIARAVQQKIEADFGVQVSLTSIRRARRRLGWTFSKTRFCPLLKERNKDARLQQASQWKASGETWHNVLFTDETTVALEHYARQSFHRKDHFVAKPQPKHPLKLHVWGMISRRGAGPMVILDGIMDRTYFRGVHH
ncbi:hypothetical protein ABVT39_020044 [Epinephelus coioides]